VVLPEPALGGEVPLPLGIHRQGAVLPINGNRTGSRGVHTETDHLVGGKAGLLPCLGKRSLDRLPKAQQVVAGMLAGEMMILGVEQDSLVFDWLMEDGTSEFLAVFAAHHKGAD
jgi:hypothetical protein